MRNLKKILALVLALMMVLSVMVFASAANYDDYSDKDQVSPEYAEAVEVLTGMDIFWGSENSFYPKSNVTRAEVATLLYRIMTGDITGSQVGIYKDYGMFDDVLETNWFAGYVNFAANSEYVVGVGDGKFNPEGDVTGYEWITMLLRAVGYDANGEISGSEWKITAARLAKQAGILGDFNETTLNSALTREEVAYLLFNAIDVPQVDYTPAFGYDDENVWGIKNPTIGEDQFNLTESVRTTVDDWGRPGHTWTYSTGNKVTVIKETPTVTYTTAVTECDVASDVGITRTEDYITYTNGTVNQGTDTITATQTVATIGAQGRLTEVYGKDRIVYIDTLLAQVTSVSNATFDAAGHLKTPSSITLKIYDYNTTDNTSVNNASTSTTVVETNGSVNYPYSVGNYVLVNAVQYTTGRVRANAQQHVDILGVAETLTGAQTTIWWNAEQHTINNTPYNDAVRFHLDQAGTETVNHTWYFDQYGNLIGVTDIISGNYAGVVTNLYWNYNAGTGAAYATITYVDGTTANAPVYSVDVWNNNAYVQNCTPVLTISSDNAMAVSNNTLAVSLWANYNANAAGTFVNNELFRVSTLANGYVILDAVNELGNATIKTGVSAVTGTAGKDSTANTIYTNSNTQYLVRTGTLAAGYTYTPVTGFNNIYTYDTNKAGVDYVDVNGDSYVDYAFVTGTPDSATSSQLIYVTNSNYNATLASNNIWYYTVNGVNLEGQPVTVQTTDFTVVSTLISNVGKAYYVSYTGSDATTATEITAWAYEYNQAAATDVSSIYGANTVAVKMDGATVNGNVLATMNGGVRFNVTGATTWSGEMKSITKNIVYVVVNTQTTNVVGVYVSSQPASSAASNNVTLNMAAGEVDVKFWNNSANSYTISMNAGETVAVALYKSTGTDWGQQGVDSYTVTATVGGTTWNTDNVVTRGNTMTFDLTAPATFSGSATVTLTWSANP